MPFKYYSFLPWDDGELNMARPGSPPAFFSLSSPTSPRMCSNCIRVITSGAAAPATTAAARRSSNTALPIPELLPQRQHVSIVSIDSIITEAAVEVRNQKSANQLAPNLVFVNDEPLSQTEMDLLRSCPNPPKKLRQGRYWYDKVSGYWGREGQKPYQIITAQLNIGGQMKTNASNGNRNILLNNRRITREEFWMLKVAGIPCEGNYHYWVSQDGSIQEEGQNIVMGRLWKKRTTKLVCAMLSLPIPPSIITSSGGGEGAQNKLQCGALRKLLLVGPDKSGTSTIFKQTKLLYGVPFTEEECQNLKLTIQSNFYRYLRILLERREEFAEENLHDENSRAWAKGLLVEESSSSGERNREEDNLTYSLGPRLKAFSDWLLKVVESSNLEVMVLSAAREYARFVEELWKDGAIQATYHRSNELGKLPRVATYFLEMAIEISKEDYVPSELDILYAEGTGSSDGLACTEFSFPELAQAEEFSELLGFSDSYNNMRYQLTRLYPRCVGENGKLLEMFEDVNIILFCISLADYDEFVVDENGISMNKMLASKQLFESIATHPTFYGKNFLLLLNKFDLFMEKISGVPLYRCEWFQDFNPVVNRAAHCNSFMSFLAERASHYIGSKFKRLFFSLTGRKLFVLPVTGLQPESTDLCLRFARGIMDWEAEEDEYLIDSNTESGCESSTNF